MTKWKFQKAEMRGSRIRTRTQTKTKESGEKYNLGPILFLQYSSVRHVLVATMWKTRFDTLS